MPPAPAEHPERALVCRVIRDGLHCIAVTTNPLAIALNMQILSATTERITLSYDVSEQFTQGNGFVQGGIISALLDFAMIFASFPAIPDDASLATVSLTTQYFRPAHAGRLHATAKLEKAGRTLIHAHATLYDEKENALATAVSPIAIIRKI